MTYEVPEDSTMSPEDRFWSACLQSWRIPASLLTLWWNSAALLWLPPTPGAHHHGPHDQLAIPEPLEAQEAPSLFA
jgi:hypothetical protein